MFLLLQIKVTHEKGTTKTCQRSTPHLKKELVSQRYAHAKNNQAYPNEREQGDGLESRLAKPRNNESRKNPPDAQKMEGSSIPADEDNSGSGPGPIMTHIKDEGKRTAKAYQTRRERNLGERRSPTVRQQQEYTHRNQVEAGARLEMQST
jgi:hypothetical protein